MNLVGLLDEAASGNGSVRFLPSGECIEFARMWEAARVCAPTISEVFATSRVGIVLDSTPAAVISLLSCWAAGVATVSLPSSGALNSDLVGGAVSLLVGRGHDGDISPEAFLARARSKTLDAPPREHPSTAVEAPSDFIQFTSGSTSSPKGIRLSMEAIGANCVRTIERLAVTGSPCTVSWLPLTHDMGLIGTLLTALVSFGPRFHGEGRLVLIDPQHFAMRPFTWLAACSDYGANVTCAPPSAVSIVLPWLARRPPGDLSRLQACIMGSEMISPALIEQAARALGANGLHRDALCPAFGCAEMTLAVAMVAPSRPYRSVRVSDHELVTAGPPLEGVQVVIDRSVVAEHLSEHGVGEIVLRGESLMSGYLRFPDVAEHRSGDLGLIVEGELVPYGRMDDWIEIDGRLTFAGHFERAAGELAIRRNCVGAVAIDGELVIVYESKRGLDLDDQLVSLAVEHLGTAPARVVRVGRHAFPLTSSGKLRRAHVADGLLDGTLVPSSGS